MTAIFWKQKRSKCGFVTDRDTVNYILCGFPVWWLHNGHVKSVHGFLTFPVLLNSVDTAEMRHINRALEIKTSGRVSKAVLIVSEHKKDRKMLCIWTSIIELA